MRGNGTTLKLQNGDRFPIVRAHGERCEGAAFRTRRGNCFCLWTLHSYTVKCTGNVVKAFQTARCFVWQTVSRSLFKNVLEKILCRLRCRIEDIIGLTMESKKRGLPVTAVQSAWGWSGCKGDDICHCWEATVMSTKDDRHQNGDQKMERKPRTM